VDFYYADGKKEYAGGTGSARIRVPSGKQTISWTIPQQL
jgi:hypothetical protein